VGWKLPTLTAVLWVVTLSVVSAVLGVLIAGPVGTVVAAIPLALGTVLAGYVPAMREAVNRRRTAEEKWDAIGEPVTDAVAHGPAALLRADRETVEFTGREKELSLLRSWFASAAARSVLTIVGAGGVGKTRLALKVASEWEVSHGEFRRVDAGQEADAVAAARRVTSAPILLVVDYAETRTDLEAMLRAVLADPGPIRVLLVARALGEWWDRLIEKSASAVGRLLIEVAPIRLEPQITEGVSDLALLNAAVPQFSRALECPAPNHVEFELPQRHLPVLVLHTAAIVAVLRSRDSSATPLHVVVAEGVLDELVQHEARYWRRSAAANGLPEDGRLLKAVVAAMALLGAATLAQATTLVGRVPDLVDASQAQRRSWARWLYELYPEDTEGRLGSLQPDLLAENHVVNQLARDSELAAACLRELPEAQAEHALTVLARAWEHQAEAPRLIANALNADLTHLVLAAARVALQTHNALGKLLANALENAPISLDVLTRVAHDLPFPSVALGEARLAATLRVWKSLPRDTDPATKAEWANLLGLLMRLSHPAEAVPLLEEAVAICRVLAASNPDRRHLSDLATTLTNLGTAQVMLGRADAVLPLEESVAVRRELTATSPESFRPDLAVSLANLGASFGELGRPAEALPAEQEAVAIRRELAATSPDSHRPELASSLNNLGNRLAELGRPADALPIAEEAVAIRRELTATNPDSHRPDLAQSLNNLGNRLAELGRPADALPIAEEAVAIRRELTATNPDSHRSDLAQSLNNLGIILADVGRSADALAAEQEAVNVRRELADTNPGRHRSDLAQSLLNLSHILAEAGRSTDALPIAEEAADIYRGLVASNSVRLQGLAQSLLNLSHILAEAGRSTDALPIAEEAADIYRDLVASNPDSFRPALGDSLTNLATVLSTLGRSSEAEQIRGEAQRPRPNS
jgi:tetratricopeptide (TPR) repeat protein